MTTATVYLGLGSNVGDRGEHLREALAAIGRLRGTAVVRASSPIETSPVGPVEQGAFLNAAAEIATVLTPRELLEGLQLIERSRGRDRGVEQRWGPRTLDIDILVYADCVVQEPGLTIPHPRLAERWFVLAPLASLAPELVPPGGRQTIAGLLAALEQRDQGALT